MTPMIETAEVACPVCDATGLLDPTCEQVAAYALLPGTMLRCGTCNGSARVPAPAAEHAA